MTFVLGAWKVECERCGFEYLNTQLKKEWTGQMVCHGVGTNHCWEPRHPQENMRGKTDRQSPPWTRPQRAEIDVSPGSGNEVSPEDL